jgi:hypothetical protein
MTKIPNLSNIIIEARSKVLYITPKVERLKFNLGISTDEANQTSGFTDGVIHADDQEILLSILPRTAPELEDDLLGRCRLVLKFT